MRDTERLAELKSFLRARRAVATPPQDRVNTRRLAPGLRREEVAAAAGVGITWYTWLEQGRDVNPSPATLARIAAALQLSESDESYLFALVGLPRPIAAVPGAFQLTEPLRSVLDAHQAPAAVMDSLFELLAYNRFVPVLWGTHREPPYLDNQLWQIFMNPYRRAQYVDFDRDAAAFVGLFRLTSAQRLGEPRYRELTAALMEHSPDFARIWTRLDTAPFRMHAFRVVHPALGPLSVHTQRFPMHDGSDSFLLLAGAADEATRRAFAAVSEETGYSQY